ncbi:MAG: hypothetical protein Q4A77_07845 [Leptotrichia hongkongensis]|nr:hypothetical protein [Leptotrichia hongkongensis]
MKAKKLLFCGIVAALSVPMMAASPQEVLRQAREDYYKSIKAPKERKIKTEKIVTIDEDGVVEEEKVKPKSPIEKLEYNAAKAATRVDFYERVVRSVQREEQELAEFDSALGRVTVKKNSVKKTRKTAK